MQFQCNVRTRTYTVRQGTIDRDNYGRRIGGEEGLRAKFRGPNSIFDSELAQVEHGWSDKDRREVEAFLIEHADFMATPVSGGVGVRARIYLAPNSDVPPEHKKRYQAALDRAKTRLGLTADAPAPTVDAPRQCLSFETKDGAVVQCPKPAAEGSDLCEVAHKTPVGAAATA